MEEEINKIVADLKKSLAAQKRQLSISLANSNIHEEGKRKILDMFKAAENGELKADFNVILRKVNDIVNATDTTHTK